MNKILRYSFVALLTMMGFGAAMAGTIVFGELGLENSVQYTEPFDGGDFTVTFAGGANDGKYYNAGAGIRVYGNGTMTVAAKSGTLKKITVTFAGDNYRPADGDVVNTGTFDAATGVWTGDAASVVFTRPSGNGHWRVAAVSTDDSEDPGTDPNPQPTDEVVSVTKALEVINALDNGATTATEYQVKGFVISVTEISTQYGNATFIIADDKTATEGLTVYRTKGFNGESITDENIVKVGDEVVVKGKLQKYVKNDVVTPEVASGGSIVSVNGKTSSDNTEPEPVAAEINVTKALEIINALENGKTTTEEYQVKGFVISISEISTQYGNATFVIADDKTATEGLTVYRTKGFNGESITDENIVKVGDEVVVKGKLQKYVKNDVVTPEVASGGSIVSVNGVSTGINEVKTAAQTAGNVYNLAGQKVGAGFKGIVIVNGKKMVQK